MTVRAINGAANTVTWAFDALGRVTSETNVLGAFGYTYDGATSRLATVTYPNNQTSTYSYLPTNQDHRLQTIHHKYPGGATLSKFDYTYDAVGNILTWRQQADTTAVNWRYGYDAADQLTSAVKESTDPVPVTQKRYAYGYDPAGNRLYEQIDDQVMAASHDSLNRLTQHTPGGPLQFVGTVNETANVSIAGQPATVDQTNTFRGPAPTINGTTTAIITATDPSGNVASRQYEVDVTGAPKAFTYDANGNMTSDGTRVYNWDARNQLTSVVAGGDTVDYSYDGFGRKINTRRSSGGLTVSEQLSVYCNLWICEVRDLAPAVTTSEYFNYGVRVDGVARFYGADHLFTTNWMTSADGSLLARQETDPFGRPSSTGSVPFLTGAGLLVNGSGLGPAYGVFREYDPEIGRWIKNDPLGLAGGVNLYAYLDNRGPNAADPLGLTTCVTVQTIPLGMWGLDSVERKYHKKQLTDAWFGGMEEGPNFRGAPGTKRVPAPIPLLHCAYTQLVEIRRVSSRPVLHIDRCEGDCGMVYYQTRSGRQRKYDPVEYRQERGIESRWLKFNDPLFLMGAAINACLRLNE